MKRFAIMAVALVAIVALVAPAMAADLSVSGQFRYRGFYQDNTGVDDLNKESRSYQDFRVRPVFTFNINDNIKMITRVRIFNNEFYGRAGTSTVLGGTASNLSTTAAKSDQASWDRGYVSIKTPYGILDVGRMTGGLWGLDAFDVESAADRIKYTLPLGNLTLLAILQKNVEADFATAGQTDGDNDTYYLAGIYKMENMNFGLLWAYTRNATVATQVTTQQSYLPYFKGKWGNFGLNAEAKFDTGEIELDNGVNTDITGQAFYVAGTAAFGPVTFELGYAWASGDASSTDTDQEQGARWGTEYTPFVVLTDVDAYLDSANVQLRGYSAPYGGITYNLTEAMSFTGLLAYATVDEKRGYSDDSVGTEFDLKFAWKAMPNLTYEILFGYLWAGDYFISANALTGTVDDTWTLYHKLQIDF